MVTMSSENHGIKLTDQFVFSSSFEQIPNARDLAESVPSIAPGKVYRSALPLLGSSRDIFVLRNRFDICQFLDLRSEEEYEEADAWKLVVSGGEMLTYKFSKDGSAAVESCTAVPMHETLKDVRKGKTCQFHRFPLLERKRFMWMLLWKLPLLKTVTALAYKLFGYEDKMKEVLLPEINALGLPLVYEIILDTAQNEIRSALEVILEAVRRNEPVLIFCKLGKDRTGILAALAMSCCKGVSRQDIINDYAKSNDIDQVALGGLEKMEEAKGIDREMFSSAPPEALEKTFDFLQHRYGSVEQYLVGIGFTVESQRALSNLLSRTDIDR